MRIDMYILLWYTAYILNDTICIYFLIYSVYTRSSFERGEACLAAQRSARHHDRRRCKSKINKEHTCKLYPSDGSASHPTPYWRSRLPLASHWHSASD